MFHFHLFAKGIAVNTQNARGVNLVATSPTKDLIHQGLLDFLHDQRVQIFWVVGPDLI